MSFEEHIIGSAEYQKMLESQKIRSIPEHLKKLPLKEKVRILYKWAQELVLSGDMKEVQDFNNFKKLVELEEKEKLIISLAEFLEYCENGGFNVKPTRYSIGKAEKFLDEKK